MKIFSVADRHSDDKRTLTAFRPTPDFPRSVEGKLLVIKHDGVRLGNHSHPHHEGFFLVAGTCTVLTWTTDRGVEQQELSAPVMFMFEPCEEHLLTCSEGMMLVGYMPITFEQENNTPATHLNP